MLLRLGESLSPAFFATMPAPLTTPAAHRTRSVAALFAGVGLSATGFIAIVTVTPLVAQDLLASARWSGLPSSLAIVGTAAGTTWLSSVMARHGRRRGLLLGYFTAGLSAALAGVFAGLGNFLLFALAIFGLGAGYGASRLSRYAAADLYEPEHRARAIGWVVWAGTIGSVSGPTLLEPMRSAAAGAGLPEVVGPFLLAAFAMSGAGLVLFTFLPADSFRAERKRAPSDGLAPFRNPGASVALAALVIGQVVMILIMTMTPIHVRGEGGGLGSVGFVIAAHTFGMYALSPLSGYVSDRLGQRPTIVVAGIVLSSSGLVSAGAGASTGLLALGLFLLGWGWNLGFVAASALLTDSVTPDQRMRVQGFADSVVWTSAAMAGLSSGVILSGFGYVVLCLMGGALSLVPSTLR